MSDLTEKRNDEIDLIDLIKILWAKKKVIFFSTFLFTAIAAVYAFTATEKWTSTAYVISPQVTDIENYISLRKDYDQIVEQDFDASAVRNSLFGIFERSLYSESKRDEYFKTTDEYINEPELGKEALLADLNSSVTLAKRDEKKTPDQIGLQVSVSADTPEIAQKSLNDLINHISADAFKEINDEILFWINERIDTILYEKAQIESNISIQHKVKIDNLTNALDIAKKAGIKDRLSTKIDTATAISMLDTKIPLSDPKLADDSYLFLLGEKNLQAQLDSLKLNEIVYPPRYYQLQEQLTKLYQLLPKLEKVNCNAYSYQSEPNFPIDRDSPKRIILLLVGAILGGILGCLWVLGKQILNQK